MEIMDITSWHFVVKTTKPNRGFARCWVIKVLDR